MTVCEIVSAYKQHLEIERNRSEHTVRVYLTDVRQFVSHLHAKDLKDLSEVDESAIRGFLATLHGSRGRATIARKVYSLRTFYRWMQDEKLVHRNPFTQIANIHVEKDIPSFLSVDDVMNLLNSISGNTFLDLRDRAILETLYSTGIRCAELVGLTWQAIDLRTGFIRVLGKGNKERIVPIGEEALEALWRYGKACRTKVTTEPTGAMPVFLNRFMTRLTTRSVGRMVEKRLKLSGIRADISPHGFRHTMATHMLRAGARILEISEILGHASLSVTQQYTHVNLTFLRRNYEAHPQA